MHAFSPSHESYDYPHPSDPSMSGVDVGSSYGLVLRRAEHQALYLQFQNRYPMGALISELLQIQDGKFIVRVMAQVGGVTLSTGLSAAYSPEMAEDQARLRALEVLGVSPASATTTQEVKAELISPSRAFRSSSPQPQLQAPTTAQYARVTDSPRMESLPQESVIPQQASLALSSLPVEEEPLALESTAPQRAVSSSPAIAPSRPPRDNATHPKARTGRTVAPVDLSDVIAQTSVEIKRLRWTETQGRQYLQKAYGKRSRQQLTDAELLDFLKFLEVQPTPSEALF